MLYLYEASGETLGLEVFGYQTSDGNVALKAKQKRFKK